VEEQSVVVEAYDCGPGAQPYPLNHTGRSQVQILSATTSVRVLIAILESPSIAHRYVSCQVRDFDDARAPVFLCVESASGRRRHPSFRRRR
jgi:hypothetical protein